MPPSDFATSSAMKMKSVDITLTTWVFVVQARCQGWKAGISFVEPGVQSSTRRARRRSLFLFWLSGSILAPTPGSFKFPRGHRRSRPPPCRPPFAAGFLSIATLVISRASSQTADGPGEPGPDPGPAAAPRGWRAQPSADTPPEDLVAVPRPDAITCSAPTRWAEALAVAPIAHGVVIHDDATAGLPHHPEQSFERLADHGLAQVGLQVLCSEQVEQVLVLPEEVGGRDRGGRPSVGGVDEPHTVVHGDRHHATNPSLPARGEWRDTSIFMPPTSATRPSADSGPWAARSRENAWPRPGWCSSIIRRGSLAQIRLGSSTQAGSLGVERSTVISVGAAQRADPGQPALDASSSACSRQPVAIGVRAAPGSRNSRSSPAST